MNFANIYFLRLTIPEKGKVIYQRDEQFRNVIFLYLKKSNKHIVFRIVSMKKYDHYTF